MAGLISVQTVMWTCWKWTIEFSPDEHQSTDNRNVKRGTSFTYGFLLLTN